MTPQESTGLAQQAYAKFKDGNIEGVLQLLSPDVHWRLPHIENVPFARAFHGRDEVGQFFTLLGAHQEVLEFEPREFVAAGDKVVALGHYAWRVKSTGRRFESDWAHVFTLSDGAIVGFDEYTNSAAVAEAYVPHATSPVMRPG